MINCSPSISIEKKTPQKVWFGSSTTYLDLKNFGCPAYAHVDNGKLEPRLVKCKFLGYKSGVKSLQLWYPETKKLVINRDVILYETFMIKVLAPKTLVLRPCKEQINKSSLILVWFLIQMSRVFI